MVAQSGTVTKETRGEDFDVEDAEILLGMAEDILKIDPAQEEAAWNTLAEAVGHSYDTQ